MFKSRTVHIGLRDLPPFSLMAPIIGVPDKTLDVGLIPRNELVIRKGENDTIVYSVQLNNDVEEGGEILLEFTESGDNLNLVLNRGVMTTKNQKECVEVNILEPEVASIWGINSNINLQYNVFNFKIYIFYQNKSNDNNLNYFKFYRSKKTVKH